MGIRTAPYTRAETASSSPMTPIAVIANIRHHDKSLILMIVTLVSTLIVVLMLAPSPSVPATFSGDKNREAAAASEQQDRDDEVLYILFHLTLLFMYLFLLSRPLL
jgi:hypothetical protein